MSPKYHNKEIFIHNGAKFDLIFLVKYLLNIKDIEIDPVYKDGLFLFLYVRYGKKITVKKGIEYVSYKYCVEIKDSLLLLPSSLDKLGKSFGVEAQKDV